MIDEGYIKYQCYWTNRASVTKEEILHLNKWRSQLFNLGLIGQYDNGIGFGNLSYRLPRNKHFTISGTQTGGIPNLTTQHYTKVTDFDWEKNYVTCLGQIKASSESLTHGALYTADRNINAVIHVHNLVMWQRLIDRVPTTNPDCAYGTPEIATEIIRLCQESSEQKIIVMSGHKEGIITFGNNLDEAGDNLLKHYNRVASSKS